MKSTYVCSRPECPATFERTPGHVAGKKYLYCGRPCMAEHKKTFPRPNCTTCGSVIKVRGGAKGLCSSCYDKIRPRLVQGTEDHEKYSLKVKEYYQNNPDKWRKHLLKRYGITIEHYDALLSEQGHACAICKKSRSEFNRNFAVDHNHVCCPGTNSCGKCVRGLLCTNCNQGIGSFRDSSMLMHTGAAYLDKWNV